MWDYVDKELSNYNKEYDKVNRNTLDEFQNIFNIDKDLDEDATRSDLNRLQRAITNNYEYMSSYGQYEARKRLKRTRMKYSDWFWFYFFMIYSLQAYQLAKMEQIIFNNVVKETYNRELKELSKVIKPKKGSINVDKLVKQPNSKGYVWSEYKDAQALYNTNELYNTYILQKRSNKPLNVDNETFKKVFDKQKHRIISIRDGKTSGSMDNMLIYLANETKIETYIFNDVKKCRFIAIHDKVTTKMCESLDGQIFNVHDWNKFRRYNGTTGTYQTYNVYGLISGVNLPPIDNNFHYCRSTITYLLDITKEQMYNVTNKDTFLERINMTKLNEKLKEYEEDIKNKKNEYTIIIQPNGNVYYFKGNSNSVKFENVDFEGSIITHNHPFNKEDNMYQSFGEDDFTFIKNNEFEELRVVTPEFTDTLTKNKNIDKSYTYFYDKALDKAKNNPNLDIQRQTMLEIKKEGYISYERN